MKLRSQINVEIYNQSCDSEFNILHNKKLIQTFAIPKNSKKTIKFDSDIDFNFFGSHQLVLNWTGTDDCTEKYFNLGNIVINDQKIPSHVLKVKPYENDYIKGLRQTEQGKQFLRQRTLYPGYRHGWYGDYEIDFDFGDKQYFKSTSGSNVTSFMGIKKERVYVDKKYQQDFHLS